MKKNINKLVGFACKARGRLAVAAATFGAALSASAQTEPTSLIAALQTKLEGVIADVTEMQVAVFSIAIGITIGFVVYRLMKSSAKSV